MTKTKKPRDPAGTPPRPRKKGAPKKPTVDERIAQARAEGFAQASAEIGAQIGQAYGAALYNTVLAMAQRDIRAGIQISDIVSNFMRGALIDAGVREGRNSPAPKQEG